MGYSFAKCFTTHNGRAVICSAVVLFLIVAGSMRTGAQTSHPLSHVLEEGEDLKYNVRYGFFDLGQVRIKTVKKINTAGSVAYQTIAYIDSYKKIPFANLHAVFESLIDTGMFARVFIGKSRDGDSWDFARYVYDYPRKRVLLESGQKDTMVEYRDTITIGGPTQDGLSLFFYARDRLFSQKSEFIPGIVKEKKANTFINFSGKEKSVGLDFVDYPVDVIGFEGRLEFTGIFGLTGGFEGWFSNDEARIPIVATMKVILGSVTLELMEWKREGWAPPKAKD